MSVTKPYPLTVRQFKDGRYSDGGRWMYIKHAQFSRRPSNYIRSFLLLQDDLLELFKYVEPGDANLKTFSFRIQELFIRTCIEIEANFKAILSMNTYARAANGGRLNMDDYIKIDKSHFLSDYGVKAPYWTGDLMRASKQPFAAWKSPPNIRRPSALSWYDYYNATKHDKANSLHLATFDNLLEAFSGLVAVISAQYMFEDFSPAPGALLVDNGFNDGYDSAIGGYFRVIFPRNLPKEERYDFDWQSLSTTQQPFQKYNYDSL